MKSILVYYPFVLSKQGDSGSKLRPIEMIRAFQKMGENEGLKVHIITGNSTDRQRQFKKLEEAGELDNLQFVYVENQTIPIWLTDPGHLPKKPFVDRQIFQN